ncbi:MAG: hypothetical protein QMD04_14230 [Anaerolineales bacterium]|nr:hypothetical protein [Anaerolineales bacterium]
MNLRCSYCQTMFALSRDTILPALEQMEDEGLNHYDAHCPKCRRANSMSRERLEKAYPLWREALKEMQEQAAQTAKEPAEVEAKPVAAKASAEGEAAEKPATAGTKTK